VTLVPAYGRDYRSKKAVLADWDADRDFIVSDFFSRWDGKPVNKAQIDPDQRVMIRYDKLRKIMKVL
jgi:hypothetical protein